MSKIVIIGGPKTGKSVLAENMAKLFYDKGEPLKMLHTECLVTDDWSPDSENLARIILEGRVTLIEGTMAIRALRKALRILQERNELHTKPCDILVWLGVDAFEPLRFGQQVMAKGCATIWKENCPKLVARGIEVEELRVKDRLAA